MRSHQPRFLFVFAHPDDETFCCGGTIALLRRSGVDVTLVCATRGDKGRTGNPKLWERIGLGRLRLLELRSATAALGVTRTVVWGYQDKRLANAVPDAIRSRLLRIFNRTRPALVVTFGPDGFTGHADHRAISRFATDAFRVWRRRSASRAELLYVTHPRSFFSVAKLPLPARYRPPELALDVRPTLSRKFVAMEKHRSQRVARERLKAVRRRHPASLRREWYRHAAGDRLATSWGFRPI